MFEYIWNKLKDNESAYRTELTIWTFISGEGSPPDIYIEVNSEHNDIREGYYGYICKEDNIDVRFNEVIAECNKRMVAEEERKERWEKKKKESEPVLERMVKQLRDRRI